VLDEEEEPNFIISKLDLVGKEKGKENSVVFFFQKDVFVSDHGLIT